ASFLSVLSSLLLPSNNLFKTPMDSLSLIKIPRIQHYILSPLYRKIKYVTQKHPYEGEFIGVIKKYSINLFLLNHIYLLFYDTQYFYHTFLYRCKRTRHNKAF